jgi:hypothetical protein
MHWLTAILILAAIVASSMAVGWLATFAVARGRHQRALTLVDLSDQGTAKIGGTHSFRNYFLRPSVAGLFHGRPASFSVCGGTAGYIRVSVAGHFVLPFQVRARKFSKRGIIWAGLRTFAFGTYLLLFVIPKVLIPHVLLWKFVAAPFLLCVTLLSVWRNYGRIGDVEFSKDTRVQVSFPGSAALVFSTDFSSEFRAMIDRTEIQDSISSLVVTRRVDHLRSIAQFSLPKGWDSKLEANCFYRRELLHRDAVRGMLTDLLTLCERIESLGKANETVDVTAPQPV